LSIQISQHSEVTRLRWGEFFGDGYKQHLPNAVNSGRFCFCAVSLFVYEISREPLNEFAPNLHGRRVWSVARTSLKIKVKGQSHQGQKTPFVRPFGGCLRFMFGKTSLASSFL